MKRCPLFVLLLMQFTGAIAQQDVLDSLLKEIPSASRKKQVELYAGIATQVGNNRPDTALYFANKSVGLAEEENDALLTSIAYNALARIQSTRGSYHLSLKHYRQSQEIAVKEKNDSLVAVTLNGIGTSLWHLGRHAESLENLFAALSIREKIGDQLGTSISKTNIGMVYQSQEKIELAEKYIGEALQLMRSGKFHPFQLQTMHTLANVYGMQGKISEALKLDEEGIAIAAKYGDVLATSLFYDNMGNCFLYSSPPDYQKAVEYFLRTLEIDSSFSNKKQMSDSYVNLGEAFLQQKKYTNAISYFLRSVELADESGYAQGKSKAYLLLSKAYQQAGQAEAAYAALLSGTRVKDSLVNTSSEASIAEMQVAYDTEKKQQQISLQKAELSKKNLILAGSILLFVTLTLLGISYYRRYKIKQTAKLQAEIMKQQHAASNAIIHAEEEERKRIARDLHDGVGQLMSAARMNLSVFAAKANFETGVQKDTLEKIMHLVDEGCREIRQVSHEMIPNTLLKKSLASAIQDFLDKIEPGQLNIHLSVEGLDERFDLNTETVLYRVIQESVNNAIKHADANDLDISIFKDKDGISATIEDNGKGFDPARQKENDGIGLKNIRTRVEYLRGTVDIDSAPGRGTVISLHIPLVK